MRACLAKLAILGALLLAPLSALWGQEQLSGTSYVTPFPAGDIYRIQVYGDAFAEGLLGGLLDALADDSRVQLQRKRRPLAGITRPEFDDEMKAEEASKDTVHIAVVMVGYNDRYNMRISPREFVPPGSPPWRAEYGRRVDRLVKMLKRRGTAIYWVGLPIMRMPAVNEPAQAVNDVVREKAYLNGIKYIDITQHFSDESGNYTPYGPDIAGKQRIVREPDGVLFTGAGYRKLAHFVEREIKRDLTQARSERAIPLAGAEAEQQRIAALRPRPSPDTSWRGSLAPTKEAGGKNAGKAAPKSAAPRASPRLRPRRPRRVEGRARPHLAPDGGGRRPGGDRHPGAAPSRHPGGGAAAHHPPRHRRPPLADGRCPRRRRGRRPRGAELGDARGRPRGAAQGHAGPALLPGLVQGRAPVRRAPAARTTWPGPGPRRISPSSRPAPPPPRPRRGDEPSADVQPARAPKASLGIVSTRKVVR